MEVEVEFSLPSVWGGSELRGLTLQENNGTLGRVSSRANWRTSPYLIRAMHPN